MADENENRDAVVEQIGETVAAEAAAILEQEQQDREDAEAAASAVVKAAMEGERERRLMDFEERMNTWETRQLEMQNRLEQSQSEMMTALQSLMQPKPEPIPEPEPTPEPSSIPEPSSPSPTPINPNASEDVPAPMEAPEPPQPPSHVPSVKKRRISLL